MFKTKTKVIYDMSKENKERKTSKQHVDSPNLQYLSQKNSFKEIKRNQIEEL